MLRVRNLPEPDRQEGPQVQLRAVRHQAVRASGDVGPACQLYNTTAPAGANTSFTDTGTCHPDHTQIYARSNRGKEVRQVVQRLNAERGCREDSANDAALVEPDYTAPYNLQASALFQHDWSTYVAPKACCDLDTMQWLMG